MLLHPKKKIVLLHVPRTSGNYIYNLVKDSPEHIVIKGKYQHATSQEVYEMLPDYKQIVILRDPRDIFYSHYYFCIDIIKNGGFNNQKLLKYAEWCLASDDLVSFVNHCITHNILCKFGGFDDTYSTHSSKQLFYGSIDLPTRLNALLGIPNYERKIIRNTHNTYFENGWSKNKRVKAAIDAFCYLDFSENGGNYARI